MGNRHSVVLANIFMSAFFTCFFGAHPEWLAHLPFFGRFLDDILGFWKGSWVEFQEFVRVLNSWSESNGWQVQFNIEQFGGCVSFLDLEIYKNRSNEFHSRLFFKATDVHAYLSPQSCHPHHIIKNIPYGVAFRVRRSCSELSEYLKIVKLFVDIFFPRRGYDRQIVRDAFVKVSQLTYAEK